MHYSNIQIDNGYKIIHQDEAGTDKRIIIIIEFEKCLMFE